MDNFNINNVNIPGPAKPPDDDKPIPFDDEPIPFDDEEPPKPQVSRQPLHLSGQKPQGPAPQKPPAQKPQPTTPTVQKPAKTPFVSADKITRVKTFYTKLHEGAINFCDQQINAWLKENPGIVIKRTNTAVGDVVGKRTEPSLVVSIWY